MANWQILLMDRLILRALKNGFKDEDFQGWDQLAPEDRHKAIHLILQNNGLGQIVFRRSWAKAIWGEGRSYADGNVKSPFLLQGPACDFHRQQMVVSDDWLKYLRENT